jgi:hypothetical protein
MEDVERNGRVFSDGVGTISMETLEQIWDGLLAGKQKKPTVLQIRYQGKCVYRVDDVTIVDMLHISIAVSYFNCYCICLEYFPPLFCSPSEQAQRGC